MAIPKLGDWGFRLVVTIKDQDGDTINVSGAVTKTIEVKSPSGTVFERTASFVTDGSDGQIYWVVTENFINALGLWVFGGYYADVDEAHRTTPIGFRVGTKLSD